MSARQHPDGKAPVKISFVVIAYNEEHNIGRCLGAVLAQEDLPDAEVVVVDDGSTDATAAIVDELAAGEPRLVVIHQPNAGRGAARAAGLAAAGGDLVAMVDADIVLPPHWLRTCLPELGSCDAVGGVAVPDGDAAYVWRRFGLRAKPTAPTMAVTGNNGLYRREVIDVLGFDAGLREGEDTDLNLRMLASGYRPRLLPELHVEHLEDKDLPTSVRWLFECGSGATRHLLWYRKVRVPDLAYAGWLALVAAAILPWGRRRLGRAALAAYLPTASAAHLAGRFELPIDPEHRGGTAGAVAVNTLLMASYFVGRTWGLARWARTRRPG